MSAQPATRVRLISEKTRRINALERTAAFLCGLRFEMGMRTGSAEKTRCLTRRIRALEDAVSFCASSCFL